jgi:phosphatidylserine/phosphatidylglycerophosphate/cardiolipin synthase-like enzyme
MTYTIDDYCADKIIEIKSRISDISVKILLDKNLVLRDRDVRNVVNRLVNSGVEVKLVENLHAKVYIVDNSLVIEGSMNLTRKGLVENEETLEIKTDLVSVNDYLSRFDETWEKATQPEISS